MLEVGFGLDLAHFCIHSLVVGCLMRMDLEWMSLFLPFGLVSAFAEPGIRAKT